MLIDRKLPICIFFAVCVCGLTEPASAQLGMRRAPTESFETRLNDCLDWLRSQGMIEKKAKPVFVRTSRQHPVDLPRNRPSLMLELSRDDKQVHCRSLTLGLVSRPIAKADVPGATELRTLEYRRAYLLFRRELSARLEEYPHHPFGEFELIELLTFLVISENAGEQESYDSLVKICSEHAGLFNELDRERFIIKRVRGTLRGFYALLNNRSMQASARVSKQELLERVRRFVKTHSGTEFAEQAQRFVPLLEKTIADEKRHPEKSVDEIKEMAKRKDVDGLIQQLQYVSGGVTMNGQLANPFILENAQAKALVELGDVAVPKLLDALSDTRLTYLGTSTVRGGNYRVLSCGECAAQILDEIMLGEEFGMEFERTGLFEPQPHLKKIEKRARKWWREYQETDRVEFWAGKLDRVFEDDWDFYEIALSLVQKYPDQALGVIGPKLASHPYVSRHFVEDIGEHKPPSYVKFLMSLSKSDSASLRFGGAKALWKLGDKSGMPMAWKDWLRFTEHGVPKAIRDQELNYLSDLSRFLLSTGPESIDKARLHFGKLTPYAAEVVVARLPRVSRYAVRSEQQKKELKAWRSTAEGRAVTSLLLTAIDDQRRFGRRNLLGKPERRICDVAALSLASLVVENLPEVPNLNRKSEQAELDREFDEFIIKLRPRAQDLLK